jgi:hypothetical protein
VLSVQAAPQFGRPRNNEAIVVWPFKPAKTEADRSEDAPRPRPAELSPPEPAHMAPANSDGASGPPLAALAAWNAEASPAASVLTKAPPAAQNDEAVKSMFSMLASDLPQSGWRSQNDDIWRRVAARDAYGPSQPVTMPEMLAGRLRSMEQLTAAIEERRAHVVLYGPRGYGKTSLVHCLSSFAIASGYIVIYGSCGAATNFQQLFRNFLRSIPTLYHDRARTPTIDATGAKSLADLLPDDDFSPFELAAVLGAVKGTRVIMILDEYDQAEDTGFNRQIAELIKNLSDRSARVHLVLVGVASGAGELMGYIPSIQRNLVGIGLTRLSEREVAQLIRRGEQSTGVRFPDEIVSTIARLGGGSPYFTRLVTFKSCMSAIRRGLDSVGSAELRAGIEDVLLDWPDQTAAAYAQMLDGHDDAGSLDVIRALGEAGVASENAFKVSDVVDAMAPGIDRATTSRRVGRFLHRLAASSPRGLILRRDAETERYHCLDSSLPTFILLKSQLSK